MSHDKSMAPVGRFDSLPFDTFLLKLTLPSFIAFARDNDDNQDLLKAYCVSDTCAIYFVGIFLCDS